MQGDRQPRPPTEDAALPAGAEPRETAGRLHGELHDWLLHAALPLWAQVGYDHVRGGFHERLSAEGAVAADARRARVQVRQVFVFACAPQLGWDGDAAALVGGGLEYFFRHYRRADGLFRTLCASDGTPLDERAFLYDQAFVLLALAASTRVLGAQPLLLDSAGALLESLLRLLKRSGPGFESGIPERLPLLSNPHMHLLEAALAWCEVSEAPAWRSLSEEVVALALTRLIEPGSGVLRERFGEDWLPQRDTEGRVIEPGHMFEWAWLLERHGGAQAAAAGLRLLRLAEAHGVQRGVVVNALLDDLTLHDAQARLWPQTERLKANARLAPRDRRRWQAVAQAALALKRYLASAPEGLWYDMLTVNNRFIAEPAPASTFYHIVTAIAELGAALNAGDAGRN